MAPLFLLILIGLSVSFFGLIFGLINRKTELVEKVVKISTLCLVIYIGTLLGVSLSSKERDLGRNEKKLFCGFYLDCHIAVMVEEVKKIKTIGIDSNQKIAEGIYFIVTLQFESNAKEATLEAFEPVAVVVDQQGKTYERSFEAEKALGTGNSLTTQPIAPGGSYRTDIVFDLPLDIYKPYLLVTEGHPIERFLELFLVGDEDSLFHKKTKFKLEL
jgi:hypothetical protein